MRPIAHARPRRSGLTRSDLIAAIVAVVVLASVSLVLFTNPRRPRSHARILKDAAQIRTIHVAMVTFARDNDGRLPVPGLINRLPDPFLREDRPGVGPEDEAQNTTANLYSSMIALEYFNTDLLISNRERNPVVLEDLDYDWSAYAPDMDCYWDARFVADLETGSNASFAHLPLTDQLRRARRWHDSADATNVVLASRGPASGRASVDSLACIANGGWQGAFTFADNETHMIMTPAGETIAAELIPDNPFVAEERLGERDTVVNFTRRVVDGVAEAQHD